MRFMHFWETRSVTSLLRSLALLAITLLFLPTLYAQTTGTLLGTVSDQSGAVVAGAKITIVNDNTGAIRETVSNQVGRFTFAGVQPGTYAIKVTSANFKTWQRTNFVMNASDTRDVDDIKLEVGSSTEKVTVEAATTQVDLVSNGERAAVLSSVEIEKLALVGRNVTELFRVLPGVSAMPNSSANNATGGNFGFTTAAPVGSPIGNGLSVNGAPYRGGAMLLLDGANIIDPGCNCYSTAVPNPEFTQEVKVQTSNFGADQPNGPVVFTAISKSGGNKYHGSGYFDARNSIFNSNTWQNNNSHAKKQDSSYYYPGGYFGGPVPGTKGKLLVWGGYEYWWQKLPSNSPLTSWVPTDAMRAGNFSLSDPQNAKYCANYASASPATLTNSCNSDLGGTVLPNGTVLAAGTSALPASAINQNMVQLMNLYFPKANVDPSTNGNQYNWYLPISSQSNGWVYRARVDYNISDATKLFLSYQVASNNSYQPAHIWWNPGNSVLFPGGGINNPTKAKTASANFLHVFSPTLTNEMILTWNRSSSPYTPADPTANYRSVINWPYKTVFGGGQNDKMLPGVYSAGAQTFPEMSQPDIFGNGGSFPLLKATPSFQDNVSKVYKNHTFKMGFYYTMVGNDQAGFNNPNGTLNFNSIDTAARSVTNQVDGAFYGSKNPMANFLMGVATAYSESNILPINDQAYRNYSFYGMDDWKIAKRLTINAGLRFEHVGRWYDRSGDGAAVWLPELYQTDVNAGRTFPGLRWHGTDPGIPTSGNQATLLLASPRLGFALDLFGTGKTVLRGGWGMYRWNDQPTNISTGQGTQPFNLTQGKSIFVSQIGPSLLLNAVGSPISQNAYAVSPMDHKVARTQAYNFTISQQLPWRSLLEVAYVGNTTDNMLMGGQSDAVGIGGNDFTNLNKIPLGGLFGADPVTGAPRPANPEATSSYNFANYFPYSAGYGTNGIFVGQHLGYSNYNGLQIAWAKQAGALNFNLNYTWSKALGIVGPSGNNSSGQGNASVDPFTVHGNYGVLSIDRPHVINMSYSYDIGNHFKGNAFLAGALDGWTVSGITTFQSGGNLQSGYGIQNLGLSLSDASNASVTTRTYYGTNVGVILPVYTCDPGANLSSQQYLNVNCITAPAIGSYGDRQAPYLSGPGYFNQDFAVRKTFSITERQKVQFRLSGSNIFNHPNAILGGLGSGLNFKETASGGWVQNGIGASYGKSTQKDGSRLFMLGLKYTF
jgi:hypothetical protein